MIASMKAECTSLDQHGFVFEDSVLCNEKVAEVSDKLRSLPSGAGTRNLLEQAWVQSLAQSIGHSSFVRRAFTSTPVAVQCTLFDKTQEKNWLVAFHQDIVIPVQARVVHPSLGVWSTKEGQLYVQAPVQLLETLLAVRIHIDDCGAENGPLRVVPSSHRYGYVTDAAAKMLRRDFGELTCTGSAGSALFMRPLLLHASSKAAVPSRRRLLHFVFGPASPGYGLAWRHAI